MKKRVLFALAATIIFNINAAIRPPLQIDFHKKKVPGFSLCKSKITEFEGHKCLSTDKEYKLCHLIVDLVPQPVLLSCNLSGGKNNSARLGVIVYTRDEKNKWQKVKKLGWNKKLSSNGFKTVDFKFTPPQKGRYLIILFRSNRKGEILLKNLTLSYYGKEKEKTVIKNYNDQVIVIPASYDSKIKRAAGELQTYIYKITGAAPRIISEKKLNHFPGKKHIYLGSKPGINKTLDIDTEKCGQDGAWIIIDKDENISIIGKTSQGTEFGVYTFLQDYCGVRWYLPGANGTFVPKSEKLNLPEKLKVLSKPRFISRMFSAPTFWNQNSCGETARKMDMQWLRHNRLAQNISVTHAFYKILPPKKYFSEHPEYFPVIKGKRYAPMSPNAQGWQPCMSNPDVVRICRDAAVEYFDKHPDKIVFSLGPNDGNGYCTCKKCKELNAPIFINNQGFNSRSRLLFSFMNKVAESMPAKYKNKFLGTLAYHWTRDPGSLKLHPQVAPIFCTNVDGNFNARNRKDMQLVKKLAANSKLVGIWAYLYGHNYVIPAFWPGIIENYIDFLNNLNVKSWYSETYQSWGRDGFKYYILAQKLWNPEVRSNKMIEEFCVNMFDNGASEIKQFLKLCSEKWNDQIGIIGPYTSISGGAQLTVFPNDLCGKLINLLQQAKQKCQNPNGKFLCDKFIMNLSFTATASKLMQYELEIANKGITPAPETELLLKAMNQLKLLRHYANILSKDDFSRSRSSKNEYVHAMRGGISFEIENIASPVLDSFCKFELKNQADKFFKQVKTEFPEYYDSLNKAYKVKYNLSSATELLDNSNFDTLSPDGQNAIGWETGSWAVKKAISKSSIIPNAKGNIVHLEGIKNCLQYMPRPCISNVKTIPINDKSKYFLSVKAKFKCDKKKSPYLNPWVCLWFYDKNGSRLRKTDQSLGILPGTKWFNSSWIITPPANASAMKIYVLATESIGEAWIDNISFKKIEE